MIWSERRLGSICRHQYHKCSHSITRSGVPTVAFTQFTTRSVASRAVNTMKRLIICSYNLSEMDKTIRIDTKGIDCHTRWIKWASPRVQSGHLSTTPPSLRRTCVATAYADTRCHFIFISWTYYVMVVTRLIALLEMCDVPKIFES